MQGRGRSRGHHGELFQGVVQDPDHGLRHVLVTLPCSHYRADAVFRPGPAGTVRVYPKDRVKALRAARLTLALLGATNIGGVLALESNIPQGLGLGSSSADVTAAIRAVADAFGAALAPDIIARLAVTAETASDALMFGDRPVLFAQRDGIVIERFAAPLPAMDVLGIRVDGDGIDTLALPVPRYDEGTIERFGTLVERLRQGIAEADPARIGDVASASARINQALLYKPHLEEIEAMGRRHGALGIQIAHSGTVMGLLFRKGDHAGLLQSRRALTKRFGRAIDLVFVA